MFEAVNAVLERKNTMANNEPNPNAGYQQPNTGKQAPAFQPVQKPAPPQSNAPKK
jgi:hypothetical protein